MTPYYQDDYVTLWHGDCLELADLWTCADVLVTDPPYGMEHRSGWGARPIAGDETTGARDAALAAWGDRPALVFGGGASRVRRVPSSASSGIRASGLVWVT